MPFKVPGGASPLQWLRKLMQESPANAEGVYHIPLPRAGRVVKIDNQAGAGNTPNHANINYRGATVLVSPEQFRALSARKAPGVNPYVREAAFGEEGIAGPQWYLNDPKEGLWNVSSHEGRNRMELIGETDPDLPIPVQLFPSGLRARNLSPEWLRAVLNDLGGERDAPALRRSHPQRNAAVLGDDFVEFAQGGLAAMRQGRLC